MAKKKYHQSRVDRRHESVGMERHEQHERMDRRHESEGMRRHAGESDYENSRHMMARDGGMIREDRSAPSNLPREVMDKYWPKAHNYNAGYVDDLFRGVEKQMNEDYMDIKIETHPRKY
jgi:hypothetical protein